MKYFLLVPAILLCLVSCKKPEACIQLSSTSVKLGEPVTFTDCSDDAHSVVVDFGDGKKLRDPGKSFTHGYERAGNITTTLTATSKNEKREDEMSVSVSVAYPQKTEFTGNWNYYQSTEYVNNIFGLPDVVISLDQNENYYFSPNDSLMVNASFFDSYSFNSSSATVTFSGIDYKIIGLYNDEMVLREFDGAGFYYTEHRFRR